MPTQLKKRNREVVNKIIKLLREEEITTISDLVEVCAGLSYQIGKSIARVEDEPTWGELRKIHLSNDFDSIAQLGVSLMLQGIMVNSWKEDYLKIVEKSNRRD